jgi:hypothetical protein
VIAAASFRRTLHFRHRNQPLTATFQLDPGFNKLTTHFLLFSLPEPD